jgi:hypothetical protein
MRSSCGTGTCTPVSDDDRLPSRPAPATSNRMPAVVRLPVTGPRQLRELAADGVDVGRRLLSLAPRVDTVLDAVELLVERAGALVTRLELLESDGRRVLAAVDDTHDRIRTLLDRDADTAQRVLRQLDDVLPTMGELRSVAPDLRDLLTASRALNELIGSVPGLGRAKKRIEEEREQDGEPSEEEAVEPA